MALPSSATPTTSDPVAPSKASQWVEPAPPFTAPLLASFIVLLWVLVAAIWNPAQYADSIEEYNWAHSFEWGYWKHPPLPTWIMRAAILAFGSGHWTSYILAALCGAGTAWFTWKLAERLLPQRTAMLAMMLWPLHHGLTWRGQVFNHNTVLLFVVAAMTWASVRAVSGRRLLDWALVGLLAGLALLTKYQALVSIGAILGALAWTGAFRSPETRRGVVLAMVIAFGLFAPHLIWALSHDLPTLDYLKNGVGILDEASRPMKLVKFFASQVTLLFSMLVAAAVLMAWPRREGPAAQRLPLNTRRWLLALVLIPMAELSATVLAAGPSPQKYWGVQTLQFLPLLLAAALHGRRAGLPFFIPASVALLVTLGGTGFYAVESRDPAAMRGLHSGDRIWPADAMSRAILVDWRRTAGCPLLYVVGPAFPAGLLSVYSGTWATVLEDGDFRKSPWVEESELRAKGAVKISGPFPASGRPLGPRERLVPAPHANGGAWVLSWDIIPPAEACASPEASARHVDELADDQPR